MANHLPYIGLSQNQFVSTNSSQSTHPNQLVPTDLSHQFFPSNLFQPTLRNQLFPTNSQNQQNSPDFLLNKTSILK